MKDFENCLKATLVFFDLLKTAILPCLHFVGALKQGDLWLPICIKVDFIWSKMLHTHRWVLAKLSTIRGRL